MTATTEMLDQLGLVKLWECWFCQSHITLTKHHAEIAATHLLPAQAVQQTVRNHIRTTHPSIWPLYRTVLDEIHDLSGGVIPT